MKGMGLQRQPRCPPKQLSAERPLSGRPAPASSRQVQDERAASGRSCSAVSDAQEVQASRSSWSSQPVECLRTLEQPSREARALEETFWHHPAMEVPATRDEAMVMMERLHQETASQASSDGVNVVAFTGGNGPALTAYLLNNLFDGNVIGCIGNTSDPPQHLEHTRYVADLLGIDLVEVDQQTWSRFEVPGGLETDVEELCLVLGAPSCEDAGLALFSGATADDMASFTRSGKQTHGIRAPLASVSRAAVNSLSKVVGLPLYEGQSC